MSTILIENIHPKIVHLRYPTQSELASSFMRFQEHYESKTYRGRVFSREEFQDWFTREHGTFDYNEYSGFNVPSYVLEPFREGKFDPLVEEEKQLLDKVAGLDGDFYLIGTFEPQDLKHETAHGLFYVNHDYRRNIIDVFRGYNYLNAIMPRFERLFGDKMTYHEDVWIDELHAHMLDGIDYLKDQEIDTDGIDPVVSDLERVFQKYCKAEGISTVSA